MNAISCKKHRKFPLAVANAKCPGFTLIELMITVVIVAILAAVAYPSYQRYVIRSNRSEAQQFMLDVANREEEYFLNNRLYVDLSTLGLATLPSHLGQFYTLTSVPDNNAQPPSYTITATPKSGTMQASDGALVLTQRGDKTPADKWK